MLHKLLIGTFCIFLFALSVQLVAGQGLDIEPGETADEPKDRTTQVTASVTDREAPSTPILVAPADDSKLKSNKPTFVWKESTDNFGLSHYSLILNGSIKFATIPLGATETGDYTLTYSASSQEYSLTVKNSLSDGSYTWRIIAEDLHGNTSTSVTWDFSIDTQAPLFVITTIEDTEVEISTQDAESIPSDPFELSENQPVLSGTGEAHSTVNLTITFTDGTTTEKTFTIDDSGNWSIQLDTLPRDQVITLDFLITDPTGNVSILDTVLLILKTPVVVVPLPQLPQPTTLPPTIPPQITIPVLPPFEYIPPVIRKDLKNIAYYIRNYSATVVEEVITVLDRLWYLLVALLFIVLPMLKLAVLISWYRMYLSKSLFVQFFWLIGWIPSPPPQGIVVEHSNQEPVQFSLIQVSGKSGSSKPEKHSLLSNEYGVFTELGIPEGEYRLSAHHPEYSFPTLRKAPVHLSWNSFYTGSSFQVKNDTVIPSLTIVVDKVEKHQFGGLYELRKAVLLLPSLNIPLGAIGFCLYLAFPSWINGLSVGLYLALYSLKKWRSQRKNTEIYTITKDRQNIKNVVVSVHEIGSPHLTAIIQTNIHGSAETYLKEAGYEVWAVDFNHRLLEGDERTRTGFSTKAADNYLPLIMD